MQNPGFPGLATVFKEHKETFMDIQRVTLLTWGDSAIPRLADTSWYCGEVQLKKSFLIISGWEKIFPIHRKNLILRDAKLHPAIIRQRCRKGLK
jgi:hypothetical protein